MADQQIRNGIEVEFDSIAANSTNTSFYGKLLVHGTNIFEKDWLDDPTFKIYEKLGILTLAEVEPKKAVKKVVKEVVKEVVE